MLPWRGAWTEDSPWGVESGAVRCAAPRPPPRVTAPTPAAQTGRPARPVWAGLLVWFLAAALAAPLGIVLHEAAHALTARAFGFEAPVLHYDSSSYAHSDAFWDALNTGAREEAGAIYPVAQAGTVALVGVVLTWLLALAACFAAPRVGLGSSGGAVLGAFALTAAIRWLPGAIYLVAVRPRYPDARPNFDEFRAASTLGVPVEVLVLVGVAVTLGCWGYLLPKMAPLRWAKGAAVVAGFAGGVAVWMVVGPHLLP